MDPSWVSIIVGIVSSIITAAVMGAMGYAALKAWMARFEERHNALAGRCEEDRALLAMTRETQGKRLEAHETEIALLKRGRQPLDYAR